MSNRAIVAILSIVLGLIFGIAAGLLAGFGLITNYYFSLVFIMVVSALLFLGYALRRLFGDDGICLFVPRSGFVLSAISVVISALAVALVSGIIATTPFIGIVYGIAFGVFAAAIFAVLFAEIMLSGRNGR